jgi:heme-degrading monooxygenase HmoA
MIARTWHGITRAADSNTYAEFLQRVAVGDYRGTPGNRGVYVLRRLDGDRAHFLLLTLWDSMESVKQFAGPEPEKAVYYPEDDHFLLGKEPHVTHYEVTIQQGIG